MPKYRIEGYEYEAATPEQAYDMHDANPVAGMSTTQRLLAGIGGGMVNVKNQLGNLIGAVDDDVLKEQREIDEPLTDTTAGGVGKFIGEAVAAAPVGGGVGGLVAKGLSRALPRALAGTGGMMAEGATEGALLAGPEMRWQGAGGGAALGGVLGGAGAVGGSLLRGRTGTPEAQRLLDRAQLTPGQMHPEGAMSAFEESWAGRMLPQVQNARGDAMTQTMRSILNDSLPPGATQMADDVFDLNEMVDFAKKQFNVAYDEIKGYPVYKENFDTGKDVWDAVSDAAKRTRGVSNKSRKVELDWLMDDLSRFSKTTLVDSAEVLAVRSQIRKRIREKQRRADPPMDEIRLLQNAESKVSEILTTQLPQKAQDLLKEIDTQYWKFQVPRVAIRKAGDQAMTPNRFSEAVRMNTPTNVYESGGGAWRQEAKDIARTFRTNTPKTGMGLGLPMAMTSIGGFIGGGPVGAAIGGGLAAGIPLALSTSAKGRNLYRGQNPAQKLGRKAIAAYKDKGGKLANLTSRAAMINALLGEN